MKAKSLLLYISSGIVALSSYLGCGKAPNQPIEYNHSSSYSTLDSRINHDPRLANLKPDETLPLSFFYNPETDITSRMYAEKPVLQEGKPLTTNLAEVPIVVRPKIAPPIQASIIEALDVGYDIARYHVLVTAPGREPRETWVHADTKAPVVLFYDELMQADSQVRTLYDEAARSLKAGTIRWKYPPIIYLSKSTELTKGAKVTDAMLNEVLDVLKQDLPSQFGYYAEQADIQVVDEVPFIKNDPNQPGKWPAHPPEDSIVIQFNNYIPGIGSSGISADYNKDGYAENNSVFLRTTLSGLKTTTMQEIGTAFLFGIFPKTLPPSSSVYLENQAAETFSVLDTKASHWGYNRPGYNTKADKDNGWQLVFKEINGIMTPCEERLLLDGIVYQPVLIPGDVNGNNQVDFPDFLALARNFNKKGELLPGDINYDDWVNFADFLTLAKNYGRVRQLPGLTKPVINYETAKIANLSLEERMKALTERLEQESTLKQETRRFLAKRYKANN